MSSCPPRRSCVLTVCALLLLGAGPSAAVPEDAVFNEAFSCAGTIEGADLAVPERVVLDRHLDFGHQFVFTGTAETEGLGVALPLATLDMSGRALIAGPPGTSNVRCNGTAQIIYDVELRHPGGVAGRYVPLRAAARGGAWATASDWGSYGFAVLRFQVKPEGEPAWRLDKLACAGTALGVCAGHPDTNSLDYAYEATVWVPDGIDVSSRLEVTIWASAETRVFVEMYDPASMTEDRAGQVSVSGWIDPQVWIDPTWEHAHEYSLHLSAGMPDPSDGDGDGVPDDWDNCRDLANADQADFDHPLDDDASLPDVQHYGDACDADLDDDGIVAPSDFFGVFRPCLGADLAQTPACTEADLDGDGTVGPSDFFGRLRPALGQAPGPGVGD